MRLSTQAHRNPEFIALCHGKKVSSCGRLDSGKWRVKSVVLHCTAPHTLQTAPGHAGLPLWRLWAAVVTGPFPPLPGSPPAVDGSGQPCGKSGWVRGVRWKQKEKGDVQMIRVLVNIPSVWTGGCNQWPWAMDCETLIPSALGQPSSTQRPLGPPCLAQNPAWWSWDSPPRLLFFKRIKTR